MNIRLNWLHVMCAGTLAFCLVAMPQTASAQTKAKHSAKRHKVSHKAKTHGRRTRKSHAQVIHRDNPPPVTIEMATPPAPVVPTGPVAGTRYDETTWRGFHSDWNGQYYFNGGKYYYDQENKFPADIPNDFNSIASRFGGVATLDNDPTLVFSGDSGEAYPVLEYNADRYKSDKKLKLKSAFFGRAYFWRDGVRYDRKITVDAKGQRCFQFVKHS